MKKKVKSKVKTYKGFRLLKSGLWKNKSGITLSTKKEIDTYDVQHRQEIAARKNVAKLNKEIRKVSKDLWKYTPETQAKKRKRLKSLTAVYEINKEMVESAELVIGSLFAESMEKHPRTMLKKMNHVNLYYFNHTDFDTFVDFMEEIATKNPLVPAMLGVAGYDKNQDTEKYQGTEMIYIASRYTYLQDYFKALEEALDKAPDGLVYDHYFMRSASSEFKPI